MNKSKNPSALKLVSNNPKIKLTVREAAAMALCRKILENCVEDNYKKLPLVVTSEGETITANSAVEIFDDLLFKKMTLN